MLVSCGTTSSEVAPEIGNNSVEGVIAQASARSTTIAPKTNTVYQGAFVGDVITESNVSSFEIMSGDKLDIALKYLAFYDLETGSGFPSSEAQIMVNRNGAIFIKLEPWSWGVAGLPTYSLDDISSGKYDYLLQKFAAGARSFGKPIFVSFGHEMNGNWYPWAGNPTSYINAYRHVYNAVKSYGANNVTWVWCPNIDSGNVNAYYPGGTYVNWVGAEGYNTTDYGMPWRSASQLFSTLITQLESYGKPIMISEFGCDAKTSLDETVNKPQWITGGFDYLLTKKIPKKTDNEIKAFVYFNIDKVENGLGKEWAIDTTYSQSAYSQAVLKYKSMFLNNVN